MLEPWDGPAIVFTDGRQIGATLDRNGSAPSRYCITDDDLVIMGSESRRVAFPENRIVRKWRLQPGKMFLIDLEQGRMIDDEELQGWSGQQQAPTSNGSRTCASAWMMGAAGGWRRRHGQQATTEERAASGLARFRPPCSTASKPLA